jgi:hypothetical protein
MASSVQPYPATKILLDHAEQLAQSALKLPSEKNKNPQSSHASGMNARPTIINHYHDHSWTTWNFGRSSSAPRTVHTTPGSGKKNKQSEDAAQAALWLCAAAIAAAVFVGSAIVLGGNARDRKTAELTIQKIETETSAALIEGTEKHVRSAVDHAKGIVEISREQSRGSILLNGAIVLSSAVCFGSALAAYETVGQEIARSLPEVLPMVIAFGSPLVFKVSAAAGAVMGISKLVRSGYNEVSTTAKEHAMHVLSSVKEARIALKI